MALISQDTILEVKRAVDIVEVVSGYFPLKRAGATYKALCPFHEEKTPSFVVTPQRQTFKCFGCGKGGDAIGFVMELEKVEYPEAIRILADKAGISIKYDDRGGDGGVDRRAVAQANEWAAGVFRGLLQKAPEAEAARQFLARRGVSEGTAETFGLGYSMESWDYLLSRGRRNGTPDKVLADAGLVVERDNKTGYYDFFRGRVMFPIWDPRGKVIAFGARQLKDDDHPKFKNTRETALFSKGRGFYALHLQREEFEATRTAYIVEGYLDVIIPYQAGVKGLIATLGTALTRDHLKILRRYVDKVVLVFDADAAGQKASERGLDLLLTENVDVFVAELPAGMDPDDVVLKLGPAKLRECLEKPREIFDFLMESLRRKHGGETPSAKARIVEDMMERLSQIPDPVKQELLLQQLAQKFGIEERTLRAKLARSTPEPAAPAPARPAAISASEGAGRELLACAFASPEAAAKIRAEVPAERYPTDSLRKIAEVAYSLLDRAGEISTRDLLALLQDSRLNQLAAEIVDVGIERAEATKKAPVWIAALAGEQDRAESRDRLIRLKNASAEEQTELLRQAMQRPKADHRRMPGR